MATHIPLPDYMIAVTFEEKIDMLDKALELPGNANRIDSINAAKSDLLTTGKTSNYYQQGKGRDEVDAKLGPCFIGSLPNFREKRPGDPGFIPSPSGAITIDEKLDMLEEAIRHPGNHNQKRNIRAVMKDLVTKGKVASYYQQGKPLRKNLADHDFSLGPIWVEGTYVMIGNRIRSAVTEFGHY